MVSFLIKCITIYQKFAPKSVRNCCSLNPSCSNYMIISLKNKGVFSGISSGFKRILFCDKTSKMKLN